MDARRDRPPTRAIPDAAGDRPPAFSPVGRRHALPGRHKAALTSFRVAGRAGHRRCPADGAARLPGCIRGLLFDMGNVLYDDTFWRRWLVQLLVRLGLHTTYGCFFRVWDREYLAEVYRGRRRFSEAFEAFLRSAGLSPGQIDEVQAASRARRRQFEAGARPLPGVKSTLERLHRSGLILGAVSNSEHPVGVLRQRLERFAVAKLFSAVVSSVELGRAMPDPACYLAAIRTMDLPADQVAFVGHDAAELAGARAVRMPTIAFNFDTDAQADVYLSRFEELVEVIDTQPPLAAAG